MSDWPGTDTWLTCPEAAFINRLCPAQRQHFPYFQSITPEGRPRMKEAFSLGFRRVVKTWSLRAFEAPRELTMGESMVWHAINLKTLRFGKLCEKIPRRLFIEGQRDHAGNDLMDLYEDPILPSTGLKDGAITRAVRGLLEKEKWMSKFESDRHPLFGSSSIYSALPLREAFVMMIVEAATEYFSEAGSGNRDHFIQECLEKVEPIYAREDVRMQG